MEKEFHEFVYLEYMKNFLSEYEIGEGFKNVPDENTYKCKFEKKNYVPVKLPPDPYIGYGWYIRSIEDLEHDEHFRHVNINHLVTNNVQSEDLTNGKIYFVFSQRRSVKCRPSLPPPPTYIGYCKCLNI